MGLYRFFASARELKAYEKECIKSDSAKVVLREQNTLKIEVEKDLSLASNYTDKKNCACLEWNYNEQNAEILIAYIKEHLKMCPRIELWNTWAGDKKDAIVKKCSKNILTKEKIKDIWGKESFEQPECLVVYNA